MVTQLHSYCPHCHPSGIIQVPGAIYAPSLVKRYCNQYWELVCELRERDRNEVMWVAQL